jgi:hypothetical protein
MQPAAGPMHVNLLIILVEMPWIYEYFCLYKSTNYVKSDLKNPAKSTRLIEK